MKHNYRDLVLWILNNTEIDNDSQISNKHLKECFLKTTHEHDDFVDFIPFKIGNILNLIYGNELSIIKGNGQTFYNVKIKS